MTETQPSAESAGERAEIEALVAACIEAIDRGEPDPAPRVCSARPDLLPRVRRRLAQLATRGLVAATDALPQSIGPYRILRQLGAGGMGDVYLAEQTEPVRRRVALKVVKLGMDTREVVARFEAERQALAQMSHPHIAQVFDAGITEQGRPYFAMEYVEGTMLTSFCDARSLQPMQRARLMATVCRAVQHAHDRGFIHRDLKPSNVLVTEHEGEFLPKIIDFGIAKATAAAGDAAATRVASMHTRADQVLGTPEYMSPEQLGSAGVDVDTRSDVYALGVTLYELLCGELPFDSQRLRRAGRGELERILRDEPPTEPSKRLSAVDDGVLAARGGQRSTIQRSVAGELDWITLKALAKNRDERYPSALALAEDLERWLRHEPVFAAPPGHTYRLRKFVRRHRAAVGAAAAVLLSLVTALVISLNAAHEARAALTREENALGEARTFYGLARDAVGNVVDAADKRLAEVPQADAVRRQMLADAIAFYEQLRAQKPRDPSLRGDLLAATQRIGTLQRRLGQTIDALATLQRCVDDVDALCAEQPADAKLRSLAIVAHGELAIVCGSLGRGDDAKKTLQQALAHADAARSLPDRDERQLDRLEAGLLVNLAIESSDDVPAALVLYERAIALFGKLGGAPDADQVRCIGRYAECLTRANRVDDAAKVLADVIARLQALPAGSAVATRESEAKAQSQAASVLRRLDRGAEARAAQQRAIDLYAELASEHPDVPLYADEQAAGLHFLCNLDKDDARLRDGLQSIARAVAIRERLAAQYPQSPGYATRCVRSLMTKAGCEIELWQTAGGDKAVAMATLDHTLQLATELRAAHDDDIDVLIVYAAVQSTRGALLTTDQRFGDARDAHVAVRDALVAKLPKFATNAELRYQLALNGNNLVQADLLLEDPGLARADGEQGLVHLEQGLALDARNGPLRELAPTLIGRLVTAYTTEGDDDSAVRCALRLCEPKWGADAKELGCLLLARIVDASAERDGSTEWLARTQQELQAAIAARGDVAKALARPPQKGGTSRAGSRLRDLDLRLALGDVLGRAKAYDAQRQVHGEAQQLLDSMPDLGDRVRNLFSQRAEAALAQQRPADAAAAVDALLARVGEDGGANYMCAVLYAQCHADVLVPTAKETLAAKAVACLRRALDQREVGPAAARHANFASLHGCADYEALLAK